MKVFVLTIEHPHGMNVTCHPTYDDAQHALADYCTEWWSREFSEVDEPMPDDREERVERYFDRVNDEFAATHECEMQPELERALIGLMADIRDHWDGDERDLDVSVDNIATMFGLEAQIEAHRSAAINEAID